MIKKIVLALAVAAILPVAAVAQKFGVVDAQTVIQSMPAFKTAQTELDEASKKYQEEFDKLTAEVDKKAQEFQALPADTPDGIKERRQAEIQELQTKAQRFYQTAMQQLQQQEQQRIAPIQQQVFDAIKSVGQEGGFTFIFSNMSAMYTGTDVVDVTPMVREKVGLTANDTPAPAK